MVSFYFVLSFVIFILIIFRIGLFFSKTKITINYINISEGSIKIKAHISLYIFNKFKMLTIRCSEKGIKIGFIFISYNKILKNTNTEEFLKKTFKPIDMKKIKYLEMILEKMHINCKIGTEDLFITVSMVTVISTLLSIFLENQLTKNDNKKNLKIISGNNYKFKNKKIEMSKYQYKILPEFGKNILIFNGNISISFKTRRISIFLSSKEHTKFKILVGG